MTRALGILGGAFDPVHNGHLHFADACRRRMNLTELRLIPFNLPPHRRPAIASAEDRLAMLGLAAETQPSMLVDDCEIQRGGVSYTIDTLRSLRTRLGEPPIFLLMGADNFSNLRHWRQWQALLECAHIVVVRRPGAGDDAPAEGERIGTPEPYGAETRETLRRRRSGCIIRLDVAMLDVSSTTIRENFRRRLDNAALLPKAVLGYIQTRHLYGNQCS